MRSKDKRSARNNTKSIERQSSRTPSVNIRDLEQCNCFVDKHVNNKSKWFHQKVQLYNTSTFENHTLPIWLAQVTYTQIPMLLSKFINHETVYSTPEEAKQSVEVKRDIKFLKSYLMRVHTLTDHDIYELQSILFAVYGKTRDVYIEHPLTVPIKHYQYNPTSQIKMNKLPDDDCFEESTSFNKLYFLVESLDAKNKQLPLSRVRQIIRSMIKDGHHRGMIMLNLEHKMPCNLHDDVGKEYAWFLPYLNPNILMYRIHNYSKFYDLMRRQLKSLKDKILNYSSDYIRYLELTVAEKEAKRAHDAQLFKMALNHPQIQQLYLAGYDHEYICDYVYANHIDHATGKFVMQVESNPIDMGVNYSLYQLFIGFIVLLVVVALLIGANVLNEKYAGFTRWVNEVFKDANHATKRISNVVERIDDLVDLAKSFHDKIDDVVEDVKNDVVKTTKVMKSIQTIDDIVNNLIKGLLTDPNVNVHPQIKLVLVDIKSICTGIYFASVGNYTGAMSELSNLAITHIEVFKNATFVIGNLVTQGVFGYADVDDKEILIDKTLYSFIKSKIHDKSLTEEQAQQILEAERLKFETHSKGDLFTVDFNERSYTLPTIFRKWYESCLDKGYDQKLLEKLVAKKSVDPSAIITNSNFDLKNIYTTIGSYFHCITNGINIKDLQLLNALTTTCKNALQFSVSAIEICKWIFSSVCLFLFGFDPVNGDVNLLINEMKAISVLHERFLDVKTQMSIDKQLCQDVIYVYHRMNAIYQSELFAVVPNHIIKRYNEVFKSMENMFAKAKACSTGLCVRKEPVVIGLFGAPGSGKSTSLNFLVDALTKAKGLDPNREHRYTYMERGTDVFFTNYVGQEFFIYDEFLQCTMPEIRSRTCTNFISMKNTVPMNLPMPDIESKGNTYFVSEYMLITSNYFVNGFGNATLNDVGVVDPEAIKRRFDIVIHRDEKVDVTVKTHELLFRIDKCVCFPALVGKTVPLMTIVALALQCEKEIEERFIKIQDNNILTYNSDELRNRLQGILDNLNHKPIPPNGDGIIHNDFDYASSESNSTSITYKSEQNLELFDDMPTLSAKVINLTSATVDRVRHYLDETIAFSQSGIETLVKLCPTYKIIEGWYADFLATASKYRIPMCIQSFDGDEPVFSSLYDTPTLIAVVLSLATMTLSVAGYFAYDWIFPKNKEEYALKTNSFSSWQIPEYSYEDREAYREWKYEQNDYLANRRDIRVDVHRWMGVHLESKVSYYTQLGTAVANCCFYIEGEVLDNSGTVTYAEEAVGFHLDKGVVVIPAHFFYALVVKPLSKIRIKITTMHKGIKSYIFDLPTEIGTIPNMDLVSFKLPGDIPTPPSSIKYFVEKSQPLVEGVRINVVVPMSDGTVSTIAGTLANAIPKLEYLVGREVFLLEQPITYYGETSKGFSGGLIAVRNSSGGVTALGMHVGSCTGRSLDKAIKLGLPMDYSLVMSIVNAMAPSVSVESCPTFPMRYSLNQDKRYQNVVVARKSKIVASMLHGFVKDHHKIPVDLRIKNRGTPEEFDPILKGLAKFGQTHYKCDFTLRDEIVEWFDRLYAAPMEKNIKGTTYVLKRLLTKQEALNGIPELYFKGINMSTSPGIPLNKSSTSGKSPHLYRSQEDGLIYMTPEFEASLDEFLKCLESGEHYEIRFAVSGKDELRLVEKVKAGKVRAFCVAPLVLIIVQRIYFGMHSTWVHSLCVDKPVAVGLNPHSVEWQKMIYPFRRCNTILAGDFANWDGKVPKDAGLIYLQHVNNWYDDEYSNIRHRIMDYIWEARVQFEDKVIDLQGGCPSGHQGTSDYNSFCNSAMIYETLRAGLGFRADQFVIKTYGDDNLIGIMCPEGTVSISDVARILFEKFGVEYTHSSKKEFLGHDTIETVSFIGRKFVLGEDGYMRAPLDLEVIKNAVCWKKSRADEILVLRNTIQSVYIELSHHSPAVFTAITRQLGEYIQTHHPEHYDALICNNALYTYQQYKDFKYGPNPKKFETYIE